MEFETQIINGTEHKIIWEVLDESGWVVEEAISEEHAHDIIRDNDKFDEWSINNRLEET